MLMNFGVAQKEIVSGLAKLSFIWELVSCVGNFKFIKGDVSKFLFVLIPLSIFQ